MYSTKKRKKSQKKNFCSVISSFYLWWMDIC